MTSTLTNAIDCDEPLHDDVEPPFDGFFDDDDDGDGPGDGEPIRWVTVASFWSIEQAHLARLKVEADDIQCVLDNENVISMNWLYANAVGGVRLRVPAEDAARARQVLEVPAQPFASDVQGDDRLPLCPSCGSADVRRERYARWMVFASLLLLGFPLPFISRKLSCGACGARWHPRTGFPVTVHER